MGYTCFQEHQPYTEDIAIKSDIVIIYGIDSKFEERVKQWKEKGYRTYFMTGMAWGDYRDYDNGKFDGVSHSDEAQMDYTGKIIGHGGGINYMVPTDSYIRYIQSITKKAIDAGTEAVVIEEPEFWINGGYSPAFKIAWNEYFNKEWEKPDSSEDSAFKSAILMQHLYNTALEQVFNYVKEYACTLNREVKCYVATHSLINYTHWRIVSPEFSMNRCKNIDGYIGQVWTGTDRTPNVYKGVKKERPFETAFMEYGVLANMVCNNHKKMCFLADPIEDDPRHSWEDYKKNYEATLIASLMFTEVSDYEVMPWPDRIFCKEYPKVDIKSIEASNYKNLKAKIEIDGPSKLYGYDVDMEKIPKWYAEQIIRINNMLSHMDQENIIMDSGESGIGILLSNTMMFQRLSNRSSNNDLSDFYGMCIPLLKNGIPVKSVVLENEKLEEYMDNYKLLLLSYNFMKPLDKIYNKIIANWIKNGGILIYIGDKKDSYNHISSWWNEEEYSYEAPQQHLFELLGLNKNLKDGIYDCSKGKIRIINQNPEELAERKDGSKFLINIIDNSLKAVGKTLKKQNYFRLSRGPYEVCWVFDEGENQNSLNLEGRFIDILDLDSPIIYKKSIMKGCGALLLNLDNITGKNPCVLISSSRILNEQYEEENFKFTSFGPTRTDAVTKIYWEDSKLKITAKDMDGNIVEVLSEYDKENRILALRHKNCPDGVALCLSQY